jgi:hypothetical protein
MLKEQTKVYLNEESFYLRLSIAEIDSRTDYVRRITSKLDGVNFRKISKGPSKRNKVYKRLCNLREQVTSSEI